MNIYGISKTKMLNIRDQIFFSNSVTSTIIKVNPIPFNLISSIIQLI